MSEATENWRPSACILCECNCGIEIKLGADGRGFERIRGDKAHPASQGYTCNKALRLDHYQNGRNDRVTRPLRRRSDGSFEGTGSGSAYAAPSIGSGSTSPSYSPTSPRSPSAPHPNPTPRGRSF